MNIKSVIVERFETSDGKLFDSSEKAIAHEYSLIRDDLYMNRINIKGYMIYLLKNQDDLDALVYNECGQSYFDLPDEMTYPCFIFEEVVTNECYKYVYRLLDDFIKDMKNFVDQLESVKEEMID